MIYLATPYSHPDPAVMEARFLLAAEVSAEIMRSGRLLFSPISHTHPIAQFDLPKGWDFWQRYDHWFLDHCTELWVVASMDGWRESKGVTGEIAYMKKLGKPVWYFDHQAKAVYAEHELHRINQPQQPTAAQQTE